MSSPTAHLLRRHPLTVADFHRMAEAQILSENDRVELIQGELIDVAPIGSAHAGIVNHLNHLLIATVGDSAVVSVQNPLALDARSEPQPDILLLRPRADFYAESHPKPRDALLLIEVAESSRAYDRDVKCPLYARSGIPEVWLVDIDRKRIEAFRDPTPAGYREKTTLRELGKVAVPGIEGRALNLADLF